jgi:methyl-accepting chemotaxis protein
MLAWFETTAPIRLKFQTLAFVHAAWASVGVAGAFLAGYGTPVGGIGLAAIGLVGAVLTVLISSRLICTPYVNTVLRMEALAAGDTTTRIQYVDYADCVGRMTKAMAVFRDNIEKVVAAGRTTDTVVHELASGLDALAEGNLTYTIDKPFEGDYDRLRVTFNRTVEGLEESLNKVATSASSVNTGSTEIRSASEDLARRTEQQAAALEETSAAMGQVTNMVAATARSAVEVRDVVVNAHKDATEGSTVVKQAVDAMDAIEKSSQEINQIINVIDGISFQTNLLALNAGVEAARAGDAGKGFAVVANEVRALAQRSADAARDIKVLITSSTGQVSQGVNLVSETGRMLERIAGRIDQINELMSNITTGTETQASNLQQVNSAVNDMDRMTQQNAAMVEQSTAASRSLAGESEELTSLVTRFRLRTSTPGRKATSISKSHSANARPIPASGPQSRGNLAVKIEADQWEDF